VHDIWCRPGPADPWRLQIMLDESEGADWVSRRDARIRLPLPALGRTGPDGIPYLTPEVQLYYKAKTPRPKDEIDFAQVLPVLAAGQRRWLADVITCSYGEHPWVQHL
jgi:hypothetical protein